VVLQDDGLSDAPSVTENQLYPPALHISFPPCGSHEPARDGGVLGGVTGVAAAAACGPGGSHEQPDPPATFRGELEPARLDSVETPLAFRQRRHNRTDARAAQAFRDGPELFRFVGWMEQE
jgi:hypothetical protein